MMYAITVRQPMAYAIIHLGKSIENRGRVDPWRQAVGRTIAVHAGLTWQDDYAAEVATITGHRVDPHYAAVHYGAIIGTVDVHDVHWADGECCDPWGDQDRERGIAHLTLQRPRRCDPIPARGALGLWRLSEDTERLLKLVTT